VACSVENAAQGIHKATHASPQSPIFTTITYLHHNHQCSRMASLSSHAVLLYLRKYNDKSF
jgi:hypothetical protein